ncbi:COX3 oxidase, partial [Acromyrmex heyeri]
WRDVLREVTFQGCHSTYVFKGIKIGIILFIISEIFFLSLFTHHSLINKNINERKNSLSLTIILGIYFSILQLIEYINSPFTIVDSIYGSTFFIAIGFHGIHVIIGTLFLIICFLRLNNLHFSAYHHFGFETAS